MRKQTAFTRVDFLAHALSAAMPWAARRCQRTHSARMWRLVARWYWVSLRTTQNCDAQVLCGSNRQGLGGLRWVRLVRLVRLVSLVRPERALGVKLGAEQCH